jgi:hypothetical protein
LKNGYDGKLSFANVCRMITMIASVIKKIGNMCFAK